MNATVLGMFAWILSATCAHAADASPSSTEVRGPDHFEEICAAAQYTREDWNAGLREVPRYYWAWMPERWRKKYANEVPVKTKKRVFFRSLAPLVLRSNELILEERRQLLHLVGQVESGGGLNPQERTWLADLGKRYDVAVEVDGELSRERLAELTARVDAIPVSLALAQAAEESGWGTSRFADLGNAFFGQWTWGGKGITPARQRAGKGDYKVAAFDSPLQSVRSYMNNLNTHRAYQPLRDARRQMRDQGKEPVGYTLAAALEHYSERGVHYVESLRTIMRVNHLRDKDEAKLRNMEPIKLVPVGWGAK